MTVELRNAPSLGVTSICYNPSYSGTSRPNLLAAASWDKKIRVYDSDANSLQFIEDYGGAVLDCAFVAASGPTSGGWNGGGPGLKLAAVGLTKELTLFDLTTGKSDVLGKHEEPIKAVVFHSPTGLVYTGGWDQQVKCWDQRCPTNNWIAKTKLHGKVFGMDLTDTRLVVVDSCKQTYIFDIRHPGFDKLEDCRDHILKYQMRCVRCFPKGTGFAVSSIEGRVAWEYFDLDPQLQTKRYAFKCHRQKNDRHYGDSSQGAKETIYPVHALAFHPQFGTFATGGGDGGVSVWDGFSKKRLWRLPVFQTSISSLAFNSSGTQLAIAVSYAYEQGSKDPLPPTQIVLRPVNEEDVKPKNTAAPAVPP